MKKTIAATAIGLLLIAGQAAAAGETAASRVGDRVGARADASDEFAGIPIIGIIAIAGVVLAAATIAFDDDSDSD